MRGLPEPPQVRFTSGLFGDAAGAPPARHHDSRFGSEPLWRRRPFNVQAVSKIDQNVPCRISYNEPNVKRARAPHR